MSLRRAAEFITLGKEAMERFRFAARLLRPRFAKYPLCLGEAHDTSTSEITRRDLTGRLLSLQMLEIYLTTTSGPMAVVLYHSRLRIRIQVCSSLL